MLEPTVVARVGLDSAPIEDSPENSTEDEASEGPHVRDVFSSEE